MNILFKQDQSKGAIEPSGEYILLEFQGVFEIEWKRCDGASQGDLEYDPCMEVLFYH